MNTNMLQMLNQLQQNPMQVLSKFGIPANISNNPRAIVQHLMNNGRVSQSQYDHVMKVAKNMGINV